MKVSFLAVVIALGMISPIRSSFGADAPAGADKKSAKASGPIIEFDSTVYDFGKTNSGAIVKHDFIFMNTGTATLEITDVHPGCGCTTAGTWDKKVEPGKAGIIPLQYNSSGFGGNVTKSATVSCNDTNRGTLTLQIKGTVWKAIEVVPTMAIFNVFSDSQTNEVKTVRITSQVEEPITLSDLQVSGSNTFRAELKTIHPGKEFELQVTAIPPFVATNPIAVPITLKTSTDKMPTINVTGYITVRDPVMVIPAQISLPPGKLKNSMSLSLMVRNDSPTPMTLSDVKVDYPGAEARVNETSPGKIFNLALSLPDNFEIKEGQKATITMKTNHPKYPVLSVPIIQPQPATFPPQNAAAKVATPGK